MERFWTNRAERLMQKLQPHLAKGPEHYNRVIEAVDAFEREVTEAVEDALRLDE